MGERRRVCTENDDRFRVKKEGIDSLLEKYDKEFNKKLNDFKLVSSKQYSLSLDTLPAGLSEILTEFVHSFGFKASKHLIASQIELARVLEDCISTVGDVGRDWVGHAAADEGGCGGVHPCDAGEDRPRHSGQADA